MIKYKFRDSRFIGWIQFLNFYDFEIADIFMRVLRVIVLSGSSDNTIILQVLSTDDPLSTWYVNTFKIWYLDLLELWRDLISFLFTIYDLYNFYNDRSRNFSQNFQEIFFQLLEQRIFFRIYVKNRVSRTIENKVIFMK